MLTLVSPPSLVMLAVTSAGAKGTPFRVSLVKTVVVVPPLPLLIGVPLKSSFTAVIVGVTVMVIVAVSQTVSLGEAMQT